jgi:hypothetical protein
VPTLNEAEEQDKFLVRIIEELTKKFSEYEFAIIASRDDGENKIQHMFTGNMCPRCACHVLMEYLIDNKQQHINHGDPYEGAPKRKM